MKHKTLEACLFSPNWHENKSGTMVETSLKISWICYGIRGCLGLFLLFGTWPFAFILVDACILVVIQRINQICFCSSKQACHTKAEYEECGASICRTNPVFKGMYWTKPLKRKALDSPLLSATRPRLYSATFHLQTYAFLPCTTTE